jgi:glycerol 2-dehydrogenase (NADP+)
VFLLVARGSTVLSKSVTEQRIKDNLNSITDLSPEDVKELDDFIANGGELKRYVYPPFGINFGFPDKLTGRSMPNGFTPSE